MEQKVEGRKKDATSLKSRGAIELRGVRVQNLKDIHLSLPRGELIVITGLSGSGKSSLAFSTLYAEGHRRYVQSLSSYARQYLERLPKPDADYIGGVPPAIVIEQRVSNRNPRSTVGTLSEIYEYLRLLYGRVGRLYSPISGKEVKAHTSVDVVNGVLSHEGARLYLLAPLGMPSKVKERALYFDLLAMEGFSRVYDEGKVVNFDTPSVRQSLSKSHRDFYLLVDRFLVEDTEEFRKRVGDSVETALDKGDGACRLVILNDKGEEQEVEDYSSRLELDGITFLPPSPELFSYNNPLGACPRCEGYGFVQGIDEALVVPDRSVSVADDAVVCWRGPTLKYWRDRFLLHATPHGFPGDKPYYQLTSSEHDMLWNGVGEALGIHAFFDHLSRKTHKIQNRVLISRFSGSMKCPACGGRRLRPEAGWVKINGRSLPDLIDLPLEEVGAFLQNLEFTHHEQVVAHRILEELTTRVAYLLHVGLGYLTINRASRTLSGGETQRINLARNLGGSLVGSLYILDEPSVGLHPVDTQRLIEALQHLRDIGNTVIVVEHDLDIMRAADRIVDLGPGAGSLGGKVVAQGTPEEVMENVFSITGSYLSGMRAVEVRSTRRKPIGYLEIEGLFSNNIENLDVRIPLGVLTVISGVSGSGKSTLVEEGIMRALDVLTMPLGKGSSSFRAVRDTTGTLTQGQFVDQNPLSRSLRSTPVTYVNAFDGIRAMFAREPLAVDMGLTMGSFSFNTPGGRCDQCDGTGVEIVEMQFMADIEAPCEACKGTRYQDKVLRVRLHGLTISDVLHLTIDDGITFFSQIEGKDAETVVSILQVLQQVGLGYIALGQPTSTLSGGEAQRLKLASFLLNPVHDEHILFTFDEPTTGLHVHDIARLMVALNGLVDAGHTVVVVEHNVEVMKLADYQIDMGPGAGKHGGKIVVAGTPEEVAQCEASATAPFIARALQGKST